MSAWWSGRRVLVTGAGGFVGGHLCRALMEHGAEVVATDVRPWPWPTARALEAEPPERLPLDVTDFGSTCGYLAAVRPSVIFHLAGVSHIAAAQADPMAAWRLNIGGTWNVLEAARRLGTIVIVASSNHVIGPQPSGPSNESAPLNQTDVYGTSKICADVITRCYGHLDMRAVALRHTNAFGPAAPWASHIVTGTMIALLRGERPVIRSDGSPRKAYLHVADVVAAYLLLAERADDVTGRAFYASRASVSVLDLVRTIIAISGRDVVPDVQGHDLTQIGYEEDLDSSALGVLGWRPASSLEDGLRSTWDWYERHGTAWMA